MIWVDGRIVADDELKVSVLDRTFEHGLGLFETMRTWNRQAPLLKRHLARMTRSAAELGLSLDGVKLPEHDDVSALLRAENADHDVMLRITLSAGDGATRAPWLWMRAAPLPPPIDPKGALVAIGLWTVLDDDPLARHKTLNYWIRRRAFEEARQLGYDETLSTDPGKTLLGEGSRTNLFVVRGSTLLTAPLFRPIVPGIMRQLVIELARNLPLFVDDTVDLHRSTLHDADEVFLTNSVRGLIPVRQIDSNSWDAPGTWTQRLSLMVSDVLLWRDQEGPPRDESL